MLVLGIETSCDDTAAAVVAYKNRVLSSVVSSQSVHQLYGGVVPEIASRQHVRLIVPAVRTALEKAGVSLDQIDALAVTMGPGLIGSLLVGLCFAKAVSFVTGKPFIGVNHVEAHLFSVLAETDELRFPFVGLCVSGGHTELMYVREFGDYQLLGSTVDDAAGEAVDKVAKMLGLGFPGGPELEALARQGDSTRVTFPRARLKRKGYDMSFSGLKTAVKYFIQGQSSPLSDALRADVAACFQKAVVDALVEKLVEACRAKDAKQAVLAGGVACNTVLREETERACASIGVRLLVPSSALCSDNAVMVAIAGGRRLSAGQRSSLDLPACSTLEELLEIEVA
ncbi:MAG: tRNA (adenosine(37)-N6)-threonylcarbamoyltransferase complex transferase subunit TsaD [Candidatus Eiseniibacteriota bacterium]|nr:MAG: tRNA (adenosine(37)-N6)-threonylcarbamoyltransferase complex transferase subunit TsaD [Candidatus Eisenbacteria bacterium]